MNIELRPTKTTELWGTSLVRNHVVKNEFILGRLSTARFTFEDQPFCYLMYIGIFDMWRRKGFGTEALRTLQDEINNNHEIGLLMNCATIPETRNIYSKQGWLSVKTIHGRWEGFNVDFNKILVPGAIRKIDRYLCRWINQLNQI